MYANQGVKWLKPLSKELRSKFERTIENAREIAEEAARIALVQLGVGESSPYSYLSEDDRALRRRLRAHGRNLGDILDSKTETQEIYRLVEEIAYEHWHRMLFARFLAENDLLMYYEDDDIKNSVPVTLSECDELAQELGLQNGWEMAARLATKMLPQVFKSDSPVYQVVFPPELQNRLEQNVETLGDEIFVATDSIGWAYQFWQNKRKKEINASEVKIGAKELPAVTQLFTEPYMVNYILDNSLGAWWARKILTKDDWIMAQSEDELRKKVQRPDLPLKYLRFIKDENQIWKVAGGCFDNWPENLSDFKVLDPCCGSGHFLVNALLMLIPMRMELESLSPMEACSEVINKNIFGLEIDKRCVEIAAFAIAFNAWKYPGAGGFRSLPNMEIAWCGQGINISKKEWLDLSGNNSKIRIHLEDLYYLFKDAQVLGSLLNPKEIFKSGSIFEKDWDQVNRIIESQGKLKRLEYGELGIIAQGMEKAIQILGNEYNLIITNVPYLGAKRQNSILQNFSEKYYQDSKSGLETVFIERIIKCLSEDGHLHVVSNQTWLFQPSSKKLREKIVGTNQIESVVRLGSGAFETISGEVVNVCIFGLSRKRKYNSKITFIDAQENNTIIDKKVQLQKGDIVQIENDDIANNPDTIITPIKLIAGKLMSNYADCTSGLKTGDRERFNKKVWEVVMPNRDWEYFQVSFNEREKFSGFEEIIYWQNDSGVLAKFAESMKGSNHVVQNYRRGQTVWGKRGIAISNTGEIKSSIYLGNMFDSGVTVILPHNSKDLSALWEYCKSNTFNEDVRNIDTKLGVTNSTFLKLNFNYDIWEDQDSDAKNDLFFKPYSTNPTQWIFHGHPRKSVAPLQVAIARLLGYRWPAELDADMELSDEARVLVEESKGLLPYADKDGIVCIPSVRGEAPASERLLNLLAAAYKDEDINMILPELLSNADHTGKSLETWVRDKFFTQHYKLFGHRPFIWQIWDGLIDGFSALVNYHKLDRKNLETLIYTYLGDWISKQKSAMVEGIDGAEEKLNAAISLKKKLELILEGESPYDIFVRWKPLNKQPSGWEPDLNDGVRVNIRPFMLVGDVGKKGSGVLRDKPNIKWTKDRGTDTEYSPWYHLFGGDRINDHHVTLEEKKKVREEMR